MTLWTGAPEAARLLKSCAADPPSVQAFACRFQEVEIRFVGERARRLRRLYRLAEPPIDTMAWREWLALDPQRAIAEAIRRSSDLSGAIPAVAPSWMGDILARQGPILSTATVG